MRQSKYKGFCKYLKKWVYGSLVTTPDGVFILEEGDSIEFIEPEYHSQGMGCGLEDQNITDRYAAMQHGFERAAEKAAENFPHFIEVAPETVGQFTGLKDRNGKDIYEGDKVNDRVNNCIVEWDGRDAKYKLAIVYDEAPEGICQTHKPFPLDATGLTIIS